MYFTLWYGVYKASDRSLHYATGGHPQAILWRQKPERSFQLLGQPGHLVGAFRNINYENVSFRLEKGDRLDLFSDGLYEAIDGTGNRWSVQDLGNFLKGQKESLNSREVVEAVQKHRNLEAFQDNVTLLQIVFK
jgi:sigma-B regulation protein RsbU (phosphoserine phosphatase)